VVWENLNTANNMFAISSPGLAQELAQIVLDKKKQASREHSSDWRSIPHHEQHFGATATEAVGSAQRATGRPGGRHRVQLIDV